MSGEQFKTPIEQELQIGGMSWKYFAVLFIITMLGIYFEKIPTGMLGAFPLMIIIGTVFNEVGNRLPIMNTYLGGGAIAVIFCSAFLVYYQVLPENNIEQIKKFMGVETFLDFYIASLITGSILGMSRKLLIKAAVGYLPIILGGVAMALLLTGIVGWITGYGFMKSVLFIAIPIMGGGMGAGAIPLSQIFAGPFDSDPKAILAVMVPAVALGNALSIVAGGLLDRLGKKIPSLSGDGKLLKNLEATKDEEKEEVKVTYANLGVGLLIASCFYIVGNLLSILIAVHPYALMIITVAIVKVLGLMNETYEAYCAKWFNFVMANFTVPLLVGIGVAYTDLEAVINAFSITYLVLVVTTVIGAILGTAIMSHLLGFYVIEGSITAGLCMSNMGGTGDIAVLSAAKRMVLIPFAQISSRIGGAFMLLLTSLIVKMVV